MHRSRLDASRSAGGTPSRNTRLIEEGVSMHERWSSMAFSVMLGIGALIAAPVGAATVNLAALRPAVTLSGNGWKFMFDPRVAEDAIVQVSFSDRDWETVVVPHSFNAEDGQSIQRTMKRG